MLGIIILAVCAGGIAAFTALIAGYSVLTALAIYSGVGVLSSFVIIAGIFSASALHPHQDQQSQPDATA